MLKETKLKFKYSDVTPTGKALKAPANLLKWCSVANSNEGTVRKKELLQGLPTNETGLPLCEAATKHCPHTDQHSSTHLQASVSPWEPDTALFMSVSATGASITLMPSEELPAWKNRKGKTDKVSALFPSQLPSKKSDDVSMQEDSAPTQEQSCFLNFRTSWMFQKRPHSTQTSLQWLFFHSVTYKRFIPSSHIFFSPHYFTPPYSFTQIYTFLLQLQSGGNITPVNLYASMRKRHCLTHQLVSNSSVFPASST